MKVYIDDLTENGEVKGSLYIENDERQFVLWEYYISKKGEESRRFHGYYTKFEHALKYFVSLKIKDTTATTLSELVREVEKLYRYIESKFDYDVAPRPAKDAYGDLIEDDSLIFCGTTTSEED